MALEKGHMECRRNRSRCFSILHVRGQTILPVRQNAAQEVLQHLREIAVLLAAEIDGSDFRQKIHLYAMNLQASIDDLRARPALYERIICMEIRPFVMEMQRLWGLDTEIFATDEGRLSYRNTIMERVKALHDAPRKEYEYDVSILLLGWSICLPV